MRLRLLDRYVLSELLYPFIFGIASFSSIFIASSMLYRITQYMTKYGASWDSVAWLFFYSLPEVINYTFPMSMLLASLMAFGKLSGSSEIIAMKSGGISYYRIVAPVLRLYGPKKLCLLPKCSTHAFWNTRLKRTPSRKRRTMLSLKP